MLCFWSLFLSESKVSLGRKLSDHRAPLFSFPSLCASYCPMSENYYFIYFDKFSIIFLQQKEKSSCSYYIIDRNLGTLKIFPWPIYAHREPNLLAEDEAWALVFYLKVPPGYPNVYSGSKATDQRKLLHQSCRKHWVHTVIISERGCLSSQVGHLLGMKSCE